MTFVLVVWIECSDKQVKINGIVLNLVDGLLTWWGRYINLDGEYDLAQARELTFIGTRRYVRRQRSWFRRDPRTIWLDGAVEDLVDRALSSLEG